MNRKYMFYKTFHKHKTLMMLELFYMEH